MATETDRDEDDELPQADVPTALLEAAGVDSLDEVEPTELKQPPVKTATGRRVVKH